ncbi:hypothetical protein GOSPT_062_00050 [Gordonia sputi NBRC 100414]|uniref:Uncharacterized protein n=1 Tax=Gordonia sputi NBRC 100414 TaxID=1089453 RepID=H5U0S3_9ACTN|nr:hypothetical protein GOSPT_062_00050 [Gordonia sputi NBRC 100414]
MNWDGDKGKLATVIDLVARERECRVHGDPTQVDERTHTLRKEDIGLQHLCKLTKDARTDLKNTLQDRTLPNPR